MAGETWPVRSDVATVFGYYGVTNGNSERRFTTAWGSAFFDNGLATHAEAHFIDREETAAYLAGGLSWNGMFTEIRGWLGSSTDNAGVLPEIHARLDAVHRTDAALGYVVSPAVGYRSFRNGVEETAVEIQIAKYTSAGSGALIASALGRATLTDPGDHLSVTLAAGLTYAECRDFSIGLTIEGGRVAYDGLLGPGVLDEMYFSIRPHASLFLRDDIELFGLMEYSSRNSYSLFGGQIGLKMHFD